MGNYTRMAQKKTTNDVLPDFDKEAAEMKKDRQRAMIRLALYILTLIGLLVYVIVEAYS